MKFVLYKNMGLTTKDQNLMKPTRLGCKMVSKTLAHRPKVRLLQKGLDYVFLFVVH